VTGDSGPTGATGESGALGDSGIVDGHGPDAQHPPGPELRRLADELRRAIDLTVRTVAPPDVLAKATDALERATALLAAHAPPWDPSVPAKPLATLDPHEYFPFSPMIGWYSPLAPPIHCTVGDGVVHGRGVLGAPYEGPPGCVHGGVIAGLFDEVLGIANITAGLGAMTGTLSIRYVSPTPLYQELRFEGRFTGVEGRKVSTTGTLHVGDRLCAEANGILIVVARERFAQHALEHGGAPQ